MQDRRTDGVTPISHKHSPQWSPGALWVVPVGSGSRAEQALVWQLLVLKRVHHHRVLDGNASREAPASLAAPYTVGMETQPGNRNKNTRACLELTLYVLNVSEGSLTYIYIWVRTRNCGCLVTWFCYQLIAKPDNKTAAILWPDPYYVIAPYWHDTGSWNPASSKTRTILYKSISWLLMSWRRKDCVMIMITYELLNLRALKFSPLNKIDLFQCLGKIFVCNFKGIFEIPHKISYPYIERYHFYTTLKF